MKYIINTCYNLVRKTPLMIPVLYNTNENNKKLVIKVRFLRKNAPLKIGYLSIDEFSWKHIPDTSSTCCGWFASNTVFSSILEANIGQIWEYSWPMNKEPGEPGDIISRQAQILESPEMGVKVIYFSSLPGQSPQLETSGWLAISDKSIRKVEDVPFPPFYEKSFYSVTVYDRTGVVFSEYLKNICKNEDGIWEGMTHTGEIRKWNPRMSLEAIKCGV